MHDYWRQQLADGVGAMYLAIDEAAQSRMLDYLALLEKWNRSFNLTAIRDPQVMVARQLLDSLSVLPFLHGERVLDVGTGAGLPGIPLALASPDRDFTLLDSNQKKTRFLRQVVMELKLENVQVLARRVESCVVEQGFDVIVSRAFSSVRKMLEQTAHLLAANGCWLAMKGQAPMDELKELSPALHLDIQKLEVPGLEEQRHLVILRPKMDALSQESQDW